ncbi:uncharacterized protein LOC132926144 [Rhopalosiphum padi]|uniref:uncharacterized protein LOC132926144 n=1 Tax=Rhopalosiphum padi TaxID=40932 RepID=UPI00298EA274|nr:uncharacterized protein LOC132926144 [Rhopalosiphum padi]
MMLMKGGKTSEKWKKYPVRIIGTFDSYETAAAKEIQIYMSESDNDEDILRRGKRLKVDNTKNTQSLDFNNDSRNSSQEEFVPMGVYKNSVSVNGETSNSIMSCSNYNNIISTDYKALCGAVESSLNCTSLLSGNHFDNTTTTTIQDITPSTMQLIGDNFENDTAVSQNISTSILQLIGDNFDNDTAASQNLIPTTPHLTTCSEFCNATNMYLNRLDKKLDLILERLNYSSYSARIPVDSDFLNNFPMKDINSLKEIKENIKSEDYKTKMKNLISSIGGTSIKNFMKRVLGRLFSNQLASECSWSGFKNNFRLDNLALIMLVKVGACLVCHIRITRVPLTQSTF